MLSIFPIPAFSDNYIWAIYDTKGNCAIVDPGDAAPVQSFLSEQQLQLKAILITHHHFDHTGGVKALVAAWQCPVYGPVSDKIDSITHPLSESDELTLNAPAISFNVLAVPGHTLDHLALYSAQEKALFSGDTLFAGGCGRVFEGTPEQMLASLDRLRALPDDTKVFCAHEYTQSNLCFCAAAAPNNQAVAKRYRMVKQQRKEQQVTLPSLLGVEKRTNVFLMIDQPDVIETLTQKAGHLSRVERFAYLREWKNDFVCK